MKTLRPNKESWKSSMIFAALVILVTASLAGCGNDKKKGGTPAKAPSGPGTSCSSCGGYSDKIMTAANASMDDQVDFAVALFAPGGSSTANYYGAVSVEGYMEVFGARTLGCTLDAGIYELRVVSPNGSYAPDNQSVFNLTNLSVEAIHQNGKVAQLYVPYMEFKDAQAIIGADGYEYQNTLWGEVHVTSVGGVNCGYYGVPLKIFFTNY